MCKDKSEDSVFSTENREELLMFLTSCDLILFLSLIWKLSAKHFHMLITNHILSRWSLCF